MNSETLQTGLPPANDRMLTTVFLAAVFHGIVILGVTFSSSTRDAGGPDAEELEVVLVGEQAPRAARNPKARYIAQRTQHGSANTSPGGQTVIPRSSPAPADQTGLKDGAGFAYHPAGEDPGHEPIVATRAASLRILYFAVPAAAPEASQVPALLEKRPDFGMTPNDAGIELRLRGEPQHQPWISADTRESDVAAYLDGWRRKIERVGTMNFPDAARRRKLSGTPVIEVTIGSDGGLLQTVVRRSSGHAEIDAAAVRILKLAAPYEPFPSALNQKHDAIRIAYEWQFLGGEAQGSSLPHAASAAPGAIP